ncbi:hypothetical protein ABT336_18830 [Micromonospora sp. NPDC000207]|uniref:hypothetical protein n=1 Tax=Micromonospora sp. NPDC000207 TaxID=3154246 RepID=UPI003333221E
MTTMVPADGRTDAGPVVDRAEAGAETETGAGGGWGGAGGGVGRGRWWDGAG